MSNATSNGLRRYLKLPVPITGDEVSLRTFKTKRVTRKRIRFDICPPDVRTASEPGYRRGLYISIRGWLTGADSRYALYDGEGRCVAIVDPVPMESWESGTPTVALLPEILRVCTEILVERERGKLGPVPYVGWPPGSSGARKQRSAHK